MEANRMSEQVNHPDHYGGDTPYEVIKVLRHWLSPQEFRGWLLGTIIKYLPRAGKKDDEVTDFKKARWYLDYLISYTEDDLQRSEHHARLSQEEVEKSMREWREKIVTQDNSEYELKVPDETIRPPEG
jgi:hypothetical protein